LSGSRRWDGTFVPDGVKLSIISGQDGPAEDTKGDRIMGCLYYFTSETPGPNGETTGYKDYKDGEKDPQGRVCVKGKWMTKAEILKVVVEEGIMNPYTDSSREEQEG
jgi:hypothetical protein